MVFTILLALMPISAAMKYRVGASPLPVLASSALATAVLAKWVRRAADQLADRVGPAIGGLLAVSFGSIAEAVLAVFVLMRVEAAVVQAQVAGSILGTGLFGFGRAIIVGGTMRERQKFDAEQARLPSTMRSIVVIALLLPAVFDMSGRMSGRAASLGITDEEVSLGVSVVLLLYLADLPFTPVTHRDVLPHRSVPSGNRASARKRPAARGRRASRETRMQGDAHGRRRRRSHGGPTADRAGVGSR